MQIAGTKRWLVQGAALLIFCCTVAGFYSCSSRPRIDSLTLLISGNQLAYVKNCGCATGQTGGVLRQMRVAAMERESARQPVAGDKGAHEVLLLDMGNFSDPSTPVKRIESAMVFKSLAALDYDVVGLGGKEITFPQQELLQLLIENELPVTCSNLKFVAPKPSFSEDKSAELNSIVKPYRVITLPSGYKVGVIHAIQSGGLLDIAPMYGFELKRPADAAAEILEEHAREAQYWIMTVANADEAGSVPGGLEKLNKLHLLFGFEGSNPLPVAANGGPMAAHASQPPLPRFLPAPYHKAKDLLRVKQFFDEKGHPGVVQDERLALRADIKPDEALLDTWTGMQARMQKLAADEANKLILARKTAKPPFHVGQAACIECHAPIVEQMQSSKHARAYITLVEKGVQTNASCVGCHVVGYGTAWGWNVKENQPALQGVQCENCHGPASYHLDLYQKKTPPADLRADGRDEFGLLPPGEAACVKCHDVDNSPSFNFATYWEKIKH